ncbi:MAG: DNA methyltransferase, partial [Candidatus Auribacterota bacterium]|nr:DNA methyltransferase [Candidatus Auribacterota bacterium]
ENFTNEGSVVLDPFMGTGTVGVSCKLLKRKFIGIEINKQYFDISEERIRRARKQLSFIM